jgi:hypothetical protein
MCLKSEVKLLMKISDCHVKVSNILNSVLFLPKTNYIFIINRNWLVLYGGIFAVDSVNKTKLINTLCRQN